MISIQENTNLNRESSRQDWQPLRGHDVTLSWREGGNLYIEHGKLTATAETNYTLTHTGIMFQYFVGDKVEMNPHDGRMVRMAHRQRRCERCKLLQLAMKEEGDG